ncbi:MAG: hypothetical protein ABH832_03885, partial [bacterium]
MLILKQKTVNNPIFYVTRDIERALGAIEFNDNFFIITNYCDFAKQCSKNSKNIFLIKEKNALDTWQILKHKKAIKFINKQGLQSKNRKIQKPQIV